jgi:hypothetical protein
MNNNTSNLQEIKIFAVPVNYLLLSVDHSVSWSFYTHLLSLTLSRHNFRFDYDNWNFFEGERQVVSTVESQIFVKKDSLIYRLLKPYFVKINGRYHYTKASYLKFVEDQNISYIASSSNDNNIS